MVVYGRSSANDEAMEDEDAEEEEDQVSVRIIRAL